MNLRINRLCFIVDLCTSLTQKHTSADVDYSVFTDAAKAVLNGDSPYARATYRYTPLLAYMMIPNLLLFRAFGKLLFVTCDLLAGILIFKILTARKVPPERATRCSAVWLLNPFVATISTRGSAESVLAVLVLSTFYAVLRKKLWTSSVLFGISVHFKIYPIIYAVPLFFMMDDAFIGNPPLLPTSRQGPWSKVVAFVNTWRLSFSLASASTFFLLGITMYYIYGYTFVYETYLYHIVRKDHRHNFSVYFYSMYLSYTTPTALITSISGFLPSILATFATGYQFKHDFLIAAFLQTWVFVMFNKVCTSQYFLWYLALLPVVLPHLVTANLVEVAVVVGMWVLAQAAWLFQAYNLEHLGINVFFQLWVAGLVFFVVNTLVLRWLVRLLGNSGPIFINGQVCTIGGFKKG